MGGGGCFKGRDIYLDQVHDARVATLHFEREAQLSINTSSAGSQALQLSTKTSNTDGEDEEGAVAAVGG